jgi:type I restriction enzyme S subunit
MEVRAGYKRTEVGVIPSDWVVKKLGDISYFSQGIQVDLEKQSKSEKPNYSKFLRIENYTQESDDYRYIPSNFGRNKWISKDDVVVVRYGATAGFIGQGKEGVLANNLFKVEPNPRLITNGYLFNYLKSDYTYNFFQNSMFGGAMPALSFKIAKDLLISLPPTIKEQTLIATALSDSDALISSLEKLIAKKRNIKKGAMQELLRPKDGWKNTTLGEIASLNKGKGLGKNEITPDGRYKCIHYGELFTKYKELIYSILSRTDVNENTLLSKRNDVLMPTSDVTPKGLATASCLMENNVILGGDILVIRIPENIINGVFLSYSITNDKTQILNLVKGVTVYHLYGSDMKKFRFNYPNIQEQNNIVRILTDMETEIEALELKLEKYKMIKQGMIQTLLTGQIRLI